jgi:hypothetical protein
MRYDGWKENGLTEAGSYDQRVDIKVVGIGPGGVAACRIVSELSGELLAADTWVSHVELRSGP